MCEIKRIKATLITVFEAFEAMSNTTLEDDIQ